MNNEMTHDEQRMYLIQNLLAEDPRYAGAAVPDDEQGRSDLLRALMNVRPPEPISREFLEIQDEYLAAERDKKGVVDAAFLPAVPADSRISLWQGDITTLRADAIVNAANSAMLGCFVPLHSCIDNIIHSSSGIQLRLCCDEIMKRQGHEEPTGQAKITPGYNLPAKYVLHTVGPIIQGAVTPDDEAMLASCYLSCLRLAQERGLKSLAFCCISTGVFHFPSRRAAQIAVKTVRDHLDRQDIKVIFDVFRDEDYAVYKELLS